MHKKSERTPIGLRFLPAFPVPAHRPAMTAGKKHIKTAILTSMVLEKLGYDVEPKYNDERVDIVQNIIFHDPELLVKFARGIQAASPIDSHAVAEASDMPGYDSKVIMACGAFTQGSSIELSCDGPLREPYIAYMQGSLTYPYGKLALMKAVTKLLNK